MVALGIPTLTDVAPGEQLAWVDRALALIPKIGNPDLRLFVTGKAAMLLVIYGDPRWAVLMERLLAETGSSPGSYQEADSFYSIGLGGCLGGHYGTARSMLAAARDWARDRSDEMLYRCRAILALISFCTGSWSELDEEIAVLLDRLSARPTERITVEAVAAGLAVTRGEPGASDRVRDVMVRAAASGEMDLLPLPVSALLRCEGTRGDVAAVVEETAAHVASWEAMGLWALGARAVPAFVEALLGAGRAREATELLSRYEAAMRDQDAPLATSALRHARGHLAAAAGQPRRRRRISSPRRSPMTGCRPRTRRRRRVSRPRPACSTPGTPTAAPCCARRSRRTKGSAYAEIWTVPPASRVAAVWHCPPGTGAATKGTARSCRRENDRSRTLPRPG